MNISNDDPFVNLNAFLQKIEYISPILMSSPNNFTLNGDDGEDEDKGNIYVGNWVHLKWSLEITR